LNPNWVIGKNKIKGRKMRKDQRRRSMSIPKRKKKLEVKRYTGKGKK